MSKLRRPLNIIHGNDRFTKFNRARGNSYVDTSKQVGDKDHLKVFANQDAAETWLEENDPEGVAFEYEVIE